MASAIAPALLTLPDEVFCEILHHLCAAGFADLLNLASTARATHDTVGKWVAGRRLLALSAAFNEADRKRGYADNSNVLVPSNAPLQLRAVRKVGHAIQRRLPNLRVLVVRECRHLPRVTLHLEWLRLHVEAIYRQMEATNKQIGPLVVNLSPMVMLRASDGDRLVLCHLAMACVAAWIRARATRVRLTLRFARRYQPSGRFSMCKHDAVLDCNEPGRPLGEEGGLLLGAWLATTNLHGYCRNLRELRLSDQDLGLTAMLSIGAALAGGAVPTLTALDLDGNDLDAEAVEVLVANDGTALRSLCRLDLSNNPLGSDGACVLANTIVAGHLPLLRVLKLSSCALEGPGAAQLFTKAFHLRERVQENYYTADIYYTMEHLPSMDASRNEVAFLDLRGNPGLHTPGFVRSATASKLLSLLRDHESGLSFAPLAFRAGFRGWLTA